MMKKCALILFFAMIFTMLIPAQAIELNEQIKEASAQNEVYGSYAISVKTDNAWNEVGSLAFGKHQSEKTIDLKDYLNETAIIKLSQTGGGAAYLDAVLLDNRPAVKINDNDEKLLNKLSKEDLDITPVNEEGIILEFNKAVNNTLTVIGRIESVNISKEPLQFPAANNYKSKNEVKDFYSYTLNSSIGKLKLDGVLDEVDNMEPFVKEYRAPDSGHPAGDTYFYVMNDEENLYVAVDTTPDNTFDGDKDYAKVYINTNDDIKEYKVSVPETTWGNTNFTYTNKVDYEHKVYEFKIPLNEIGNKDTEISLAFVVYGTVSIYQVSHKPALAYDSENDLYLCVFEYGVQDNENNFNNSHIYAELIDNKGNVMPGTRKAIADINIRIDSNRKYLFSPDVAYNSKNNTFTIVWQELYDVVAAIQVKVTGNNIEILNNPIAISKLDDTYRNISSPKIAYDSINDVFLAVWEESYNEQINDENFERHYINGQFINSDFTLKDEPFSISNIDQNNEIDPSISYSPGQKCFLVAWKNNGEVSFIEARAIQNKNKLSSITSLVGSRVGSPDVEVNKSNNIKNKYNTNDLFFVSFRNDRDIVGEYFYLNASFEIEGHLGHFTVMSHEEDYNIYSIDNQASYFNGNDSMLCVWSSLLNDDNKAYARLRYVDFTRSLDAPFLTNEDKSDCDSIKTYQSPIAITGNDAGYNLIAYEIEDDTIIGYRIIPNGELPQLEPSLEFNKNTYNVQIDKTTAFSVHLKNYNNVAFQDVTDNVVYSLGNSEIASISTSGAIVGLKVGTTTVSAIYADSEIAPAFATIIVSPAPIVPTIPSGSSSTIKAPIGEIIVDNKVLKILYKEDVKVKNNIYEFNADKSGKKARLWLDSYYYKNLAKEQPNRTIKFNWDDGAYALPLNCQEVLNEIDASASKINIYIDKIDDKDVISIANKSAQDINAEIVSQLIDFSVTVEKSNSSIEIDSLDFYGEKNISKLSNINEPVSTAMKLIESKKALTFAPSVFSDNYVTIKYRGNGIFTVIKNPKTFDDISAHWAKINIEKLASRNIAFGRENNLFKPNDYVTRAEFAVMITRALGITEEEGSNQFKDVSSEWFAEDIKTAYDKSLINGKTDGNFYPNEKIQRKDMAVIIKNALEFTGMSFDKDNAIELLLIFNDSSTISNYAREAVAACVEAGIIVGRENQDFDPDDNATRAEASAIVERMLKFLDFIN